MKKCLDETTIQAYVDGELPAPASQSAAAHLAQCAACSAAVADAERDGALLAAAFAPGANVPVPTELLRTRINAAVAQLEAAPESASRRSPGWDFGALLAPFTGLFSFTPQRAVAFASVLALVAFGVIFYAVRQRTTTPAAPPEQIAREEEGPPRPTEVATPSVSPGEITNAAPENNLSDVAPTPPRIKRDYTPRVKTRHRHEAGAVAATPKPSAPPAEALVPGEKNYREAIASLEKVVETGGDTVLVPSARIEYERNIAVLDRAIEETRRAALRNPKDQDAVGFLMAAYQSKVELLSTVAEQTQVAAVGR